MKVTVTKSEIAETTKLLELLDTFEKLRQIGAEHAGGVLSLSISTSGRSGVGLGTDYYQIRNKVRRTAFDQAEHEIELLARDAAIKLVEQACEIIKRHMPIPVEV